MRLPQAWTVANFDEAIEIVRGVTFSKNERSETPSTGMVPCLRSGNVQQDLTTAKLIYVPANVVKSDSRYIRRGDTIVSMSNSYDLVGKVALADERHEGMTFGAFLSSFRSDTLDNGYLYNLLRSPEMQEAMRGTASQTVNISNLSMAGLAKIQLPVPPLAEQRRIVAKLNALTARLARARAELDRVPVLSAQMVEKAYEIAFDCEGETTKLGSITPSDAPIIYGILQPGPDTPGGIPYVRPTEIDDGAIRLDQLRRTTPTIAAQYKRATIRSGDIILTIVGTIGKVAVVPSELDGGNITQSSCRIRPDQSKIDPEFLRHWLQSPQAWVQYDAGRLGTAVPRLNLRDIREFALRLPPVSEQHRIGKELGAVVARADRLEAEAARARALLDRLESALLAKAFRGELVPQDPNDEPAQTLLDRIRAGRSAVPRLRRSRKPRMSA